MADTFTPHAKLTQMETGSHETSWGDVANANLDLLEEMAWGYEVVVVTGSTYDLPAIPPGASGPTRHAFISFSSSQPSIAVRVPNGLARIMGVHNGANGPMVIQHVSGGASVALLAGGRALILCTGSDVYLVSTTASNAATLNGIAANQFATLANPNLFTKSLGHAVVTLSGSASYTPDATLGNIFSISFTTTTGTLNNPTGMSDGQELIFYCSGASMTTLNKGNKFRFPGGAAANPYSGAGKIDMIRGHYMQAVDLIQCEYIPNLS